MRMILKYIGKGLLTILGLLVFTYVFIYIYTEHRIGKEYQYVSNSFSIKADSASIAKGEHLYQIRGCMDCHGNNLEGGIFMNDPLLIQVTAPNLTKGTGGLPLQFDTDDWIRVIRHGVAENGRSLFMMPSHELYEISDEDLSAIISYCQSMPPVNTNYEKMHSIGPVGRLLLTMDNVTILPAEKIDHKAIPVPEIEKIYNANYGKYLATSCTGCHRSNMQGGGPLAPGFPEVPDITTNGHVGNWNADDFISSIKTGKTPEGKVLDNQYMPWKSISHFTDEELRAIFLFLHSLPVQQ